MKFSVPFTAACLLGGASAAALVERESTIVVRTLNQAVEDVGALSDAVDAFNGDPQPLLDVTKTFLDHVDSNLADVQANQGPIGLNDLGPIGKATGPLLDASNALVAKLLEKKPVVEQYRYCSLLQENAAQIREKSNALIDAVTDKAVDSIKDGLKSIGEALKKPLNEAVENYKDCTDAPCTTCMTTTTTAPTSTKTTTVVTTTPTSVDTTTGATTSAAPTTASTTGATTSAHPTVSSTGGPHRSEEHTSELQSHS